MADIHESMEAEREAVNALGDLVNYCSIIEEGEREAVPGLVLGLGFVALCKRLAANGVRADYVARDTRGS